MRPRVRASALWGLTASLLFVVLALGYRLATGTGVGLAVTAGVASVVGVATAGLAYAVELRLG